MTTSTSELGICVVDSTGVIRQMSHVSSDMLGWGVNELIGGNVFDLMPKNQVAIRRAANRNVFQTGRPYSALSEFIARSGAPLYVDLTITAGRDMAGGIDGVIGLWQPLQSFSDYPSEPIPQGSISSGTADYIAAMLRELSCLVGPTDDRLRAYLLSTLKQAMRADCEARFREILDYAKLSAEVIVH